MAFLCRPASKLVQLSEHQLTGEPIIYILFFFSQISIATSTLSTKLLKYFTTYILQIWLSSRKFLKEEKFLFWIMSLKMYSLFKNKVFELYKVNSHFKKQDLSESEKDVLEHTPPLLTKKCLKSSLLRTQHSKTIEGTIPNPFHSLRLKVIFSASPYT